MTIRGMVAVLVFLFPTLYPAVSTEIPETFKDHVKVELENSGHRGVIYLPRETRYTKRQKTHWSSWSPFDIVDFRLGGIRFSVSFDPGPSEDPSYVVIVGEEAEEHNPKNRPSISGRRLFFSESGNMYADGAVNTCFNVRRKYIVSGKKIKEVKQPYYLVDLPCQLSADLVMTSRPCGQGDVVATLPKGTTVHVLLTLSHDFPGPCGEIEARHLAFLVRTPFGLVGWAQTREGHLTTPGSPLDCIRWMGD